VVSTEPVHDATTAPDDDLTITRARQVGDVVADAVVAAFAEDHPGVPVRELVGRMVAEVHRDPEEQDPRVAAYLVDGPELPAWADHERIARGQAFFRAHGPLVGAALFCASLPEAYAAADGVEVLAVTAELVSNPRKRIAETGRFLVEVMAYEGGEGTDRRLGLGKGGEAYRSVRGVRLMHAAVRALVRDRLGEEWVAAHGVPVNQQDLVGTLLTFTSVVYRAFDHLGIEYSAEDADAHLHTWCVIGWLLGIDERLLPWSRAEADELAALLREKLRRPSPAGALLARALLDELEEAMPRGALSVPRTVIRHLVGDECADLLGLPAAARWRRLLGPLREIDEVGGVHGPAAMTFRTLSKTVGRAMFSEYIASGTRGERVPFAIPADLARSWRLAPARQDRRTQRRRRRMGATTSPMPR
jgi:hypothetical protein